MRKRFDISLKASINEGLTHLTVITYTNTLLNVYDVFLGTRVGVGVELLLKGIIIILYEEPCAVSTAATGMWYRSLPSLVAWQQWIVPASVC